MNYLSIISLLFVFAKSVQGARIGISINAMRNSCLKKAEKLKVELSDGLVDMDYMSQQNENLLQKINRHEELFLERENINEQQKDEIESLKKEIARLKEQSAPTNQKLEECEGKPDVQLSGWFTAKNGYQYTVTNKLGTFDESEKLCESMGGKLASKGMRDLDLRRGILDGFKPKGAWIGLYDAQGTMQFKWNDGVAGTKENIHWAADQPNGNGQEMCGQVSRKKGYRTNDFPCERSLSAVCEREAPAENSR